MNCGPTLEIPYLSFKLAHIWFVWTFLAKNKIGMLNFHFGDNLDPKFIPRRIPWGWTGDQPYFVVELFHIWFEWSLLAKNKIGMLNFNFGNDSEPQIHPQKDSLGIPWGWTLFMSEIPHIWFDLNFLASDKIGTPKFYFGDNLGLALSWIIVTKSNKTVLLWRKLFWSLSQISCFNF